MFEITPDNIEVLKTVRDFMIFFSGFGFGFFCNKRTYYFINSFCNFKDFKALKKDFSTLQAERDALKLQLKDVNNKLQDSFNVLHSQKYKKIKEYEDIIQAKEQEQENLKNSINELHLQIQQLTKDNHNLKEKLIKKPLFRDDYHYTTWRV